MPLLRSWILVAFLPVAAAWAADTPAAKDAPAAPAPAATEKPVSFADELQRVGVKLKTGPATVPLGKAAELKLPENHRFVGPDSLDKFYEVTQNMRGGREVGVVLAPNYMLFFDYDDVGYVKDEDKDKLDADKLLKAMTESEAGANEERKKRGWDQMKLNGWATAPYYDAKTNNLKWAINLSSSQDGYKEVFINESIRLLGRGGVMNVTLVSGTAGFNVAEADAEKLLANNFGYVAGEKYAEFKAGDKIAAYGLSALVLGGAGVMAAKLGFFAKLGVLFGKFWKVIVFAVIALGAGIKKFWDKIIGSKAPPPSV
ncbi:DUF2167 domain-containing protein [Horticoccus sp. 23ND18S-11]|uniref:DUF2167 domain-containing protein n=1 Tax=Horticoccus sp. 23ND18S-11 TaxID=3391832 RepID=UPI0039C8CF0D